MKLKFFIAFLLAFCVCALAKDDIAFADGENYKTELRTLDYFDDVKYLAVHVKEFFETSQHLPDQDGFYITMGMYNHSHSYGPGDGVVIAFVANNSRKLNMLRLLPYPCEAPEIYKCRKCLKKYIWKDKDDLVEKCTSKSQISDSLYALLQKFMDENRMSISGTVKSPLYLYSRRGEQCNWNVFSIIRRNKSGENKIIKMDPPGCIDNEMKMNKELDEYIYLYEYFYALFHENFKECRWNVFTNKKNFNKCLSY